MEASSHHIIEEVSKRRKVTREFPDDVVRLAKECVEWLDSNNRSVSVRSMQSMMVTLGMAEFTPDGFVQLVWKYIGARGDIESLCASIGIHMQEESNENEYEKAV